MVTIACPHCGCQLKVSEKAIGEKAKCADCGETFIATRPLENPIVFPTERAASVHPPTQFKFNRWTLVPIFVFALIGLSRIATWRSVRSEPPRSLAELRQEYDDTRSELGDAVAELREMDTYGPTKKTFADERRAERNPRRIKINERIRALQEKSDDLRTEIQVREREAH